MKLIVIILIALAVAAYTVLQIYGNKNDVIGALTFGIFLFLMSSAFFIKGALPFRQSNEHKRQVRIATGCLILSALYIPILSIMTWRFPPDGFGLITATIALLLLLLALFGSATPWVSRVFKALVALNKAQRDEIEKQKHR